MANAIERLDARHLGARGIDRFFERGEVGQRRFSGIELTGELRDGHLGVAMHPIELAYAPERFIAGAATEIACGHDARRRQRIAFGEQRELIVAAQDLVASHLEHRDAALDAVAFAPPLRALASDGVAVTARARHLGHEFVREHVDPCRRIVFRGTRRLGAFCRALRALGLARQFGEAFAPAREFVHAADTEPLEYRCDLQRRLALGRERCVRDPLLLRSDARASAPFATAPRHGAEGDRGEQSGDFGERPPVRDRETDGDRRERARDGECDAGQLLPAGAVATCRRRFARRRRRARARRVGGLGRGAQIGERVVIDCARIRAPRRELAPLGRRHAHRFRRTLRFVGGRVGGLPGVECRIEVRDALGRKRGDVVVVRALGLQRGEIIAIGAQIFEPRAHLGGAQRLRLGFRGGAPFGDAVALVDRRRAAFARQRQRVARCADRLHLALAFGQRLARFAQRVVHG
jgi:hypothetical protein